MNIYDHIHLNIIYLDLLKVYFKPKPMKSYNFFSLLRKKLSIFSQILPENKNKYGHPTKKL